MDEIDIRRPAKRVLIIVSRRSPHWQKAWTYSEELIPTALRILRDMHLIPPDTPNDPSAITFLAKERWDSRIFLVFDMFHDTYDPGKAHLSGQNNLLVLSVSLGQRESASIAGRPMQNKVNSDIRALHNATGLGRRPPSDVDQSEGRVPFYPNPRTSSNP